MNDEEFTQFLREHWDAVKYGDYIPTLDEDGNDVGGEYEIWVLDAEEGMGHWIVDADLMDELHALACEKPKH